MAQFSEMDILTRLYLALTEDGNGMPAFRTVSQGLAIDSVNSTHIDWGLDTDQVSAADMPIEDAGGHFATDNVEAALQQLAEDLAEAGAPDDATYIVQVPSSGLSNEQALSALATGLLKNTTTTGVLSIAVAGTDYYAPGSTDVAVADGGTGSSNASDARTALGLAIGSNVQAYSALLAAIAGLTPSDSVFIVGNGTTFVGESGATARTSMGLGTGDSPTFTGLSLTNDLAVTHGGTGGSDAATARSNLSAAQSGTNSDITSLTGIAAAAGIVLNPHGTSSGNTSELRFKELAAGGSNYVGFKAPDAIGSNVIWTLPDADGSDGQFMKTNGAGVLSWGNAGESVSVKTGDYTILSGDNGKTFVNQGASGKITLTLPSAVAGFKVRVYVYAAQEVQVDAGSGDDIRIISSGLPYIKSPGAFQDFIELLALDSTSWIPLSKVGSWLGSADGGFLAAGSSTTTLQKLSWGTETTSQLSTAWPSSRASMGSLSSSTRGYTFGGGQAGYHTAGNYMIFSTGTSVATGATLGSLDLNTGYINSSSTMSSTNGYLSGGLGDGTGNEIQKVPFSTEAGTTMGITLTAADYQMSGVSNANTCGYLLGGLDKATQTSYRTYIQKLTFNSSEARTTIAATLAAGVNDGGKAWGSLKGWMPGGYDGSSYVATIVSITFSSEARANLAATLNTGRSTPAGLQFMLAAKSYACGGSTGSDSTKVDDLIHSSETSAELSSGLAAAKSHQHGLQSL